MLPNPTMLECFKASSHTNDKRADAGLRCCLYAVGHDRHQQHPNCTHHMDAHSKCKMCVLLPPNHPTPPEKKSRQRSHLEQKQVGLGRAHGR
mmetsp:Transcript_42940/g.97052  ORF Transcript_42940/g.97052 Transcript_42940/m.97052 type:complete len:92 (-) Transcript_42940:286-561(-)